MTLLHTLRRLRFVLLLVALAQTACAQRTGPDVPRVLAYTLAFLAVVQAIEWGALQPLQQRLARWRR